MKGASTLAVPCCKKQQNQNNNKNQAEARKTLQDRQLRRFRLNKTGISGSRESGSKLQGYP
jgi:hypothetical protein